MIYAILTISTGTITYLGPVLHTAATALQPGTTFGSGYSEGAAIQQARERREWHIQEAKR